MFFIVAIGSIDTPKLIVIFADGELRAELRVSFVAHPVRSAPFKMRVITVYDDEREEITTYVSSTYDKPYVSTYDMQGQSTKTNQVQMKHSNYQHFISNTSNHMIKQY